MVKHSSRRDAAAPASIVPTTRCYDAELAVFTSWRVCANADDAPEPLASSRWAPLPDGPDGATSEPTFDLHPRDPRMIERKDAYRRRHKSQDEQCGTGFREGSAEALRRAKLPLVLCGREGCTALVQLLAVRRAARAACRDYMDSDGCGSRSCARRHRPERFASTQRRWAAQLLAGSRPLVARPTTGAQKRTTAIVGDHLTVAVSAALAALPAQPRAGCRRLEL